MVRDCATDCVSPLWGSFFVCLFFSFIFMVLPMNAIQEIKPCKRLLGKTNVIVGCTGVEMIRYNSDRIILLIFFFLLFFIIL